MSAGAYSYDPAGNIASRTIDGTTTNFSYDALDRLTGAGAISYAYDGDGNRTSMSDTSGTTTYSYDAADQLSSVTPPGESPLTYSYDANGNETTAGPWTYGFNLANQLVSASNGTASASYSYDGDGNRLTMTAAGATTNYSWDPNFDVPELSLERDSTGSLIRRYLYGEGRISVTTPQTTAYFSVDNVGTPTALSDPTGASLGSFDRNPFGDGLTSSGVDPSVADVPIGFTGELQDRVSGLVDLRARNYDRSTGRFVSPDPMGQYEAPYGDQNIGEREAIPTQRRIRSREPIPMA